jgi:pimeloyl-ACP methyl ester carboxylesterase
MAIKKDNSTKISFDIIGDENSSKTLLFIHGAGGNKEALRALASQLTDNKCILIDLPGHYLSEGDVPEKVSEYAVILERFIQSQKDVLGDNITCIGHSMGGFVSLELALKKVPEIKRLIILNSGAYISVDHKFMDKVRRGKIDKMYLYKCSGSYVHPRTIKFFMKNFKQMITSQNVMIKDFLAVEKNDLRNAVKDITLPTIIITGEKEILALPEYSEYLHSQIQGSKLVIMKGVAHLMPIIVPEKLSVYIKAFFEKHNN